MSGRGSRIDVLMPTYNSVEYLDEALNALEKVIPRHQLIAVDRHSTDGTLAVLKKHGAQVYTEDKSLGNARQKLFESSTSPIIFMLDSDVVITDAPRVRRALRMLGTKSGQGSTVGAVPLLPSDNPPPELEKFKHFWWRLRPSMRADFFVTHSTFFLRKSLQGLAIPPSLGAAEDVYIWLHLRRNGYISRAVEVEGTHYFTLSEKKGRWMGANLRILQSYVGLEVLQFVLRNVLFYPFLAFVAALFTRDLELLKYNIKRWLGYLTGYMLPSKYWQIDRST